jgi:hypothetical protein
MLFFVVFMALIHVFLSLTTDKHPTLNEEAVLPDVHLENAKKYARENDYKRSAFHIKKAIEVMRVIEEDVCRWSAIGIHG